MASLKPTAEVGDAGAAAAASDDDSGFKSGRGGGADDGGSSRPTSTALCASCDWCRIRKTKCDGNRPCGVCLAKFRKKNKHAESGVGGGVDLDVGLVGCVYSPARRRGPRPGFKKEAMRASVADLIRLGRELAAVGGMGAVGGVGAAGGLGTAGAGIGGAGGEGTPSAAEGRTDPVSDSPGLSAGMGTGRAGGNDPPSTATTQTDPVSDSSGSTSDRCRPYLHASIRSHFLKLLAGEADPGKRSALGIIVANLDRALSLPPPPRGGAGCLLRDAPDLEEIFASSRGGVARRGAAAVAAAAAAATSGAAAAAARAGGAASASGAGTSTNAGGGAASPGRSGGNARSGGGGEEEGPERNAKRAKLTFDNDAAPSPPAAAVAAAAAAVPTAGAAAAAAAAVGGAPSARPQPQGRAPAASSSTSSSVTWEERFEQLQHFRRGHGHCRVPTRYDPNPGLGHWVRSMRAAYKARGAEGTTTATALTDSRLALLESVGFEWCANPSQAPAKSFDEWLSELRQFKAIHGHVNVPRSKGNSLGEWCHQMRNRRRMKCHAKEMPAERIQALDAIGFDWNPAKGRGIDKKSWDERFDMLLDFRRRNGHCRIPTLTKIDEQRDGATRKADGGRRGDGQGDGAATPAACADGGDRDDSNNDDVGNDDAVRELKALSRWAQYQRKEYANFVADRRSRLTKARIKKLEEIGFPLKVGDGDDGGESGHFYGAWTPWEDRYAQLIRYKTEHGHTRVPQQWKSDQGLANWVHTQRKAYKKNLIQDDKMKKLDAIGFEWVVQNVSSRRRGGGRGGRLYKGIERDGGDDRSSDECENENEGEYEYDYM